MTGKNPVERIFFDHNDNNNTNNNNNNKRRIADNARKNEGIRTK